MMTSDAMLRLRKRASKVEATWVLKKTPEKTPPSRASETRISERTIEGIRLNSCRRSSTADHRTAVLGLEVKTRT